VTGAAPVIAVDGPSGTGKGTLCVALSAALGWHLLDSGALYRAVAYVAMQKGVPMDDAATLAAVAADLAVRFEPGPAGDIRVLLDARDISAGLRTEDCARGASTVAAVPPVRAALLGIQRGFRRPPGLVADGRDMGTCVFPDAELKIFLLASAEERARRRYKQLKQKGLDVSLARLSRDIAQRDERDSSRAVSPLRPAPDAVVLDTTELDTAAVLATVREIAGQRGLQDN